MHEMDATTTTSRRVSSARVALLRNRSISSFRDEFLLDVRVGARDVCLGLVEVVVRDEILDGVLGEELAELGPELRSERLVWREHQRGPLLLRDDVGDGEGLPGPGHPEEDLLALALHQSAVERADRFRLVTSRCEGRKQLESGHPSSLIAARRAPNSPQSSER